MIWQIVPEGGDTTCGSCGHPIAPGVPVAFVTRYLKRRCQTCAGAPVDWDQIAALSTPPVSSTPTPTFTPLRAIDARDFKSAAAGESEP